MLVRRVIACLDVRNGRVVKGVRFRDHKDMGDIVELADRYARAGVDELVFYDITASPERRSVAPAWVSRVCDVIDIPFCVAGGLGSVDAAAQVLASGADKISINTPALRDPDLIDRMAARFGSQCVVLGVDSARVNGGYRVHRMTGKASTVSEAGRDTCAWIREAIERGAGEVVLNCMRSDGVKRGYDIAQLRAARAACPVPLIASGGAGAVEHFEEVFTQADVDGALAASVFHSGQLSIGRVKSHLLGCGVPVRP